MSTDLKSTTTTNNDTAVKDDRGKWRMSLISSVAMRDIGMVLDFGTKKYAEHNWRKGFIWSRLFDAAMRHLFAWLAGEDNAKDSGLPHLAHAACNLIFLLEFKETNKGTDDRFPVPEYLSVD